MEFVCQYDVREILGQGSFSEVKRCIDKRTRQAFAVKEMAYETDEQRERIDQEIQVSLRSFARVRLLHRISSKNKIEIP